MKVLNEFIEEIKNFGQSKVSKLAKIDRKTIYRWCAGKTIPTLDNAQKVADVMGLEFLLFEKEDEGK